MSLEKLLDKIKSDGIAEAEAILAEARTEARRIEEETAVRARDIHLEQFAAARRSAERESMRRVSNARSSARIAVLAAKQEMLARVVEAARERLEKLSDAEYRAWLKVLVLESALSGREEIVPAVADRPLFDTEFMAEVNKELAQRGLQGNLRLSADDARAARGCVIREGGVEINLSVDILLKQAFQDTEDELAGILFEERA
jgi:V/A-type H+-transporting ATPase subunit E